MSSEQPICLGVACIYECTDRADRQGGPVSKVTTLPWPGWRKWSRCSRQSRFGRESEGLDSQPLTMGPRSQTAGHTKARPAPSSLLTHCNRAGISHWPVNSHSIKLLFNLTPGLHRNQDESGAMYLGKWPHRPSSKPSAGHYATFSFSIFTIVVMVTKWKGWPRHCRFHFKLCIMCSLLVGPVRSSCEYSLKVRTQFRPSNK